jgi:hypothetical protein
MPVLLFKMGQNILIERLSQQQLLKSPMLHSGLQGLGHIRFFFVFHRFLKALDGLG